MIVFLDFDGVTHRLTNSAVEFDPRNIGPLELVFETLDCDVVISSSWKLFHTLDQLKEFVGPTIARRVIGVTPDLVKDTYSPGLWVSLTEVVPFERHREIELYFKQTGKDDVWFAIDDVRDFFEEDAPLYLVDSNKGFTYNDADLFRTFVEKRIAE